MAAPRWIFIVLLVSLSLQLCSSSRPLDTDAMGRKEAQDDHDHQGFSHRTLATYAVDRKEAKDDHYYQNSSHRTLASYYDMDRKEVKDDQDHQDHNGHFSKDAAGRESANNNNVHSNIKKNIGCVVPPPDCDRCRQNPIPPSAPPQLPPCNCVTPPLFDPKPVIPLPRVIPTPTCQPAVPCPPCGIWQKKEHSKSVMAMASGPESG